ncbi:MAG: nucleotide exchange factor GrpE [Xenococcaceae cyanobacterium MO_188.B19]|nr:nucleotide exchange factor GrpE [Xenococcaceae cyanobacterium MO_188.B19]
MIDEQNQQTTTSETPSNTSETTNSGEIFSENAVQEVVDEPQDDQSIENQDASSQETNEILEGERNTENEAIISTLQQENANLKKLLDEKIEQSSGIKAQYARLAADFDNFRKRTSKEKESLTKQTKKAIVTELLPVVDNFERARVQIQPATEGEQTIQNSYQGVYKTLVDCLKRLGVSAMRPEGQEFDPNFHEAMLREATDEHPEGTVIEQLMRGYMLEEQVIRHAMVKVAVPKEPVITSEEEETTSEDEVVDEN